MIYPVDSVIHPLNNPGLEKYMLRHATTSLQQARELKRCSTRDFRLVWVVRMYSRFCAPFKLAEINIDIRGLQLKHYKGEGIGISKHTLNTHVTALRTSVIDVKLTAFLTTSLRAGSTWDRALCCCRSCVSSSWNLLILTVTEGTVEKCKINSDV